MQSSGAFIKVFVSKPKIQKYMNIRESIGMRTQRLGLSLRI